VEVDEHCGVNGYCVEWWYFVMRYCVASGGIFLPTFQDKLSVYLQEALFPKYT